MTLFAHTTARIVIKMNKLAPKAKQTPGLYFRLTTQGRSSNNFKMARQPSYFVFAVIILKELSLWIGNLHSVEGTERGQNNSWKEQKELKWQRGWWKVEVVEVCCLPFLFISLLLSHSLFLKHTHTHNTQTCTQRLFRALLHRPFVVALLMKASL